MVHCVDIGAAAARSRWSRRAAAVLCPVTLCWREARPVVQVMFLMRYFAGALLVRPGTLPHPERVALGAAAWCCATVAVYAFNGIADRVEDRVNGSRRPIASGTLSVRVAACAAAGLAAAGLGGAWLLGHTEGWAAMVLLAVGYAYSGPPLPLKRTYPTCACCAVLMASATYLAGAAAAGVGRPGAPLVLFAGVMSVWMGGVGGIAKDLSDVAGDRAAGRRSLPIVFGEARTRRALAVAAGAVALAFAALAPGVAPWLIPSAAMLVLGAGAVAALSVSRVTRGTRPRQRLPYRAFMGAQYAAHLALGVALWLR